MPSFLLGLSSDADDNICRQPNICILQIDNRQVVVNIEPQHSVKSSEPIIIFYLFVMNSTYCELSCCQVHADFKVYFELAFCSFSNFVLVMICYVLSIAILESLVLALSLLRHVHSMCLYHSKISSESLLIQCGTIKSIRALHKLCRHDLKTSCNCIKKKKRTSGNNDCFIVNHVIMTSFN